MEKFLDNFVPVLSEKNVYKVEKIIAKNNIDTIIEYGSGSSTIYFLNKYKSRKIKLISIENTKFWFYRNIYTIKKLFEYGNENLKKNYWSDKDYKYFYSKAHSPYTPIIEGNSRIENWKRIMKLTPLIEFRFVRSIIYRTGMNIKNPFTGKFKILIPIFILLNKILRKIPKFKNENSQWTITIKDCQFIYNLISPSIKDQFGESPNREEYTISGINSLGKQNNNILVMIDGGPRHFIVDKLIHLLKDKNLHICLFDAYRPEYKKILNKYPGQFYEGNDNLINKSALYDMGTQDEVRKRFILEHELWYYFSPAK